MRKLLPLALLLIAGIVVVNVITITERPLKGEIVEEKTRPYGAQPEVAQDVSTSRGEYGEIIFQHTRGIDIIPPKRNTGEFSGYKSYRVGVLQDFASEHPGKGVSAQVTFDVPLTVEEFDNFVNGYSIEVIGVDGILKDGKFGGGVYPSFVQNKEKFDLMTNTVLKGSGEELLKIQDDGRVLLVDLNIEGYHARVLP